MVFVIRKQEISTPIMKADGCSIVEAWTEKFVLDVFRDGFSICRGPLGSGLKKNWRVAALKYLRPVTYVPCKKKTSDFLITCTRLKTLSMKSSNN